MIVATPFLLQLRNEFLKRERDIRDVGGSVRDSILGKIPHDRDLCTNATPDEQISIYTAAGIRYEPTGLAHGTLTVISGSEIYEITSLRIDSDHDGRHATVTFTHDWTLDQSRRDLTINSMAMDFDGILYDPFNGKADLLAGRIRFVGEARERIKEDYLRILRYFRFIGRYARPVDTCFGTDHDTIVAIQETRFGLQGISVERVWSEMAKILSGSLYVEVINLMDECGVSEAIGMLPAQNLIQDDLTTLDPVTRLVASQGRHAAKLAIDWKMSRDERAKVDFLIAYTESTEDIFKLLARGAGTREQIVELAYLNGDDIAAQALSEWVVPVFPLGGEDLLALGFKPGKEFGQILKAAKQNWLDSDYQLSRESMILSLRPSIG